MVDDLMTTSWWYQHKVTDPLLGDINIARSCGEFFNRHRMRFQIQFLTQGLKILGHRRSGRAVGHEPKGGAAIFGITHKIMSERGAEIFVAWRECIPYAQIAHQSLDTTLRTKMRSLTRNKSIVLTRSGRFCMISAGPWGRRKLGIRVVVSSHSFHSRGHSRSLAYHREVSKRQIQCAGRWQNVK
jgi:hypothetical protein